MIKNNKWKLIFSSIVIFLPTVLGIVFWEKLPERIATHWGLNGEPDGFSSRPVAVFIIPLVLLLVHWACIFFTSKDPKNKGQNGKVLGIAFWLSPAISLFAATSVYAAALGKTVSVSSAVLMLLGVILIVVGNYMPKCKANHTIGVRVKWTLKSEENWNATHRFTGRLWFFGGILLCALAFLPVSALAWTAIPLTLVFVIVPIIYSYRYSKKHPSEETAFINSIPKNKTERVVMTVGLIVTALILVFVAIVIFVGEIEVSYFEDSFTIQADFWSDLTVEYDEIEAIEYRDSDNVGSRTVGLGGARLYAGSFKNEEFGAYTRYSYVKCKSCVILTVGENTLVINGSDAESTKEIYDTIRAKLD